MMGTWPNNQLQKLSTDGQSSVQSLSRVRLFATPWTAARQASLSITNSRSSLKLMPIELVMPSNHLILCRPLLLLPSIPPSIRVSSNESALHMRRPKYWSVSFSISPLESRMAVAKRPGRGKPTKIEQREVQGLEWEPQVKQTTLLAGPIYIGQAQGQRNR